VFDTGIRRLRRGGEWLTLVNDFHGAMTFVAVEMEAQSTTFVVN
jgi:hypothetical protein